MTSSSEAERRLHLGLLVNHDQANGVTPSPDIRPQDRVIAVVQRAEREKLDFAFIADFLAFDETNAKRDPCQFEPISLMAVLAHVTSHIGLVGTVTTTYTEPFNGARMLAAVDLLSGGRGGWNIVTSGNDAAARNYGSGSSMRHGDRYVRGAEYVEVVTGLWNSFEADAFTNAPPGYAFDPAKLHILNHQGKEFSVRGPIPAPRSPQGQPVLFTATGSSTGLAFAAKYADVVVTTPASFAPPDHKVRKAREFYRTIKQVAADQGRDPAQVIVSQMITPVFGRNFDELMSEIDHEYGLKYLHSIFDEGVDFYKYDLDAPFPEVGRQNGFQSVCDSIVEVSQLYGWTLRDVARCVSIGTNSIFGSAEQIADQIEQQFHEEATDGFVLFSGYGGEGQRRDKLGHIRFMDEVMPILRKRGLYHDEYRATTLRGNLGMPPASMADASFRAATYV
jgi:FMN-dependent oxidoreductase (nitrilotriacetate monooxygenase family)